MDFEGLAATADREKELKEYINKGFDKKNLELPSTEESIEQGD